MAEQTHETENQTALEAGREGVFKDVLINNTPFLLHHQNMVLTERSDLRERPLRIKQTIQHTTAESFVNYFNQFGSEHSVLFINTRSHTFTAVIDWHQDADTPEHCEHRSTFEMIETEDWLAWKTNNGKCMTQEQFGRFIEDHLEEITTPPGAEMLEIALSIQAKTNTQFSQAQRLDNGQFQLTYQKQVEGSAGPRGNLNLPQTFTIGLIMYEGSAPYKMDARLRYRIKDGALTLSYELVRPHKTIDANVNDTFQYIAESTEKDGKKPAVYFGHYD